MRGRACIADASQGWWLRLTTCEATTLAAICRCCITTTVVEDNYISSNLLLNRKIKGKEDEQRFWWITSERLQTAEVDVVVCVLVLRKSIFYQGSSRGAKSLTRDPRGGCEQESKWSRKAEHNFLARTIALLQWSTSRSTSQQPRVWVETQCTLFRQSKTEAAAGRSYAGAGEVLQ